MKGAFGVSAAALPLAVFFLALMAPGNLQTGEAAGHILPSANTTEKVKDFSVSYLQSDKSYTTGDLLKIEAEFTVPEEYAVDETSVAVNERARVNDWLEVTMSRFLSEYVPGGLGEASRYIRYRIALDYQIFYVPEETVAITIPDYPVRFRKAGDGTKQCLAAGLVGQAKNAKIAGLETSDSACAAFSVLIPGGNIAISSLTEKDSRVLMLSPDMAPRRPDNWRVVIAALALLASAGGFVLTLLGYMVAEILLEKRRSPFRTALRRVKYAGTIDEALNLTQGSFNEFAGRSYFGFELNRFFGEHGCFAPLEPELRRFFALAEGHFFSGSFELVERGLPATKTWLAALLRKLLRAHIKERRRGL